ncbi:flagellar hook-basal body complex protein, partial [Butyricicoccus sp. 1XD8-22]
IEIDSSTGQLFVSINNTRYEISAEDTLIDEEGNAVDLEELGIEDFTTEDYFETVQDILVKTGTGTAYTTTLTNTLRPIQIPTTAQSMSIAQDGTIKFVDANGKLQVAGQIQLAKFPNTGGLEKAGSNYYKETSNSGQPVVGTATENGIGSIEAGFLEMSNVDLSEEFTEMIVTQRGFQANSRIITTSDEILQELVNLKR